MDGLKFPEKEKRKECKALTLRGFEASWPIGLREAKDFPCIALCEGGPDFLAAMHFAYAEEKEDRIVRGTPFRECNGVLRGTKIP